MAEQDRHDAERQDDDASSAPTPSRLRDPRDPFSITSLKTTFDIDGKTLDVDLRRRGRGQARRPDGHAAQRRGPQTTATVDRHEPHAQADARHRRDRDRVRLRRARSPEVDEAGRGVDHVRLRRAHPPASASTRRRGQRDDLRLRRRRPRDREAAARQPRRTSTLRRRRQRRDDDEPARQGPPLRVDRRRSPEVLHAARRGAYDARVLDRAHAREHEAPERRRRWPWATTRPGG